ncbi:hypothetical protein [Pseudorhodoferax sp. Leaf267]|uniref:hypothetical protein n=1 Tax=Pseudorhodoferax sp. Leaf267 TaxID=1736316 RepID=UPI0006F27DC8|nr:hypothetical protein [Pseudorhodoferax sp. Leaf267]KQP11905.1 hypothetical protein ASF43_23420 [Pseudorhodoferax sp. Leaf267]
MTGLKHARKRIEENPRAEAAMVLADLVISLESETPFLLERLNALKLADFVLSFELIAEWRMPRYYSEKGKLLDLALQAQNLDAQ